MTKETVSQFDSLNAENLTQQVVRDADNGIGLSEPFDNVDDFMVSLNATLPSDNPSKHVDNRIGIAKDISFPANFDDIDYGTTDLFGLNA